MNLSIFLDLGGVINNKEQQITQWQYLVGECCVEWLGGTEEAWTSAHRVVTQRLLNWEQASNPAPADFVSFYRSYQLQWFRGMCELVGKPLPSEEECLRLAYSAIGSITSRVRAALPGTVETIHLLHRLGYTLHLASGTCSLELAGYLDGLGVRHCFGRLYGADLINTFKEGPEYYEHLFADAGIEPSEAVVVDDDQHASSWAAQTGAQTILVSPSSQASTVALPRIEGLAELPALLQQ
jgi:HAD superfamily hydrolase (TIGR01509 family)